MAPKKEKEKETDILFKKRSKRCQLLLNGLGLALSLYQAFGNPSPNVWLFFQIIILLSSYVTIFFAYLNEQIVVIGRCCLPLVEMMSIFSMSIGFVAGMSSRGAVKCEFQITTMCLGITLATFVIRLNNLLGEHFGFYKHGAPPPTPNPTPLLSAVASPATSFFSTISSPTDVPAESPLSSLRLRSPSAPPSLDKLV